ncbi:HIT family protein [Nesterenkonia aerolata]|uniref:HIT domain-containing protein n=1 Tax=Nesterenkonia aerolata TaxID=3074079 RepID=A0ABU2DRN7_9MICC|nr:HIT domain-containing protein [Nesterenkonia sp. LY-0111]MDR8019148.1 HIT domain-containing protein [Nesterenkonia sp. LY-0111]
MTAHQSSSADESGLEEVPVPAGVPDAFQRLWNPHRVAYVRRGQDQVTGSADCPFCAGPRREDEEALIVARGRSCFVILNLYPYNPGHLLISPYRHVPDLTDLSVEESVELTHLTQVAMTALRRAASPQGFNLGVNQGKPGGAGIAAHLHQHVVPRWQGDGNFLPIIAETKNMSQTLGQTLQMLREVWDEAREAFDAAQQAVPHSGPDGSDADSGTGESEG